MSAATLRDGAGKAVGTFSFFTDLSERTAMEEKLREALAAAEEANRAKSAFLANMSHEIRTPMNAVLGMTSLVLEADLSQEQRELLEMVDASGKKLVTLLNDILDLSRFEAGKLSLAREPFSLRKTLDQVLKPPALPARQKEKTGAPVCMPGKECRRILLAEDTPRERHFYGKDPDGGRSFGGPGVIGAGGP